MNQFNGRDSRFYLNSANHVYDNDTSGLASDTVQGALDELAAGIAGAAYSDEAAQDAVGDMLLDTDDIAASYVDATPTLSWLLKKQAITARTAVVAAAGDYLLATDASDSDNLKKILVPYGGVWTPTLTNVANVDSSSDTSFGRSKFTRTGSIVHCCTVVNIDPTAVTTLTKVGISLPIASDFVSVYELIGQISRLNASNFTSGIVVADTTNNRAEIQFYPNSTSADDYYVSWSYQIV